MTDFRDILAALSVPAYDRAWDAFLYGLAHELWMIGGRNSIKSTIAGYMIPVGVMAHPGVNAMVLRKHEVGLATSVYPNIKQCIEWLDEKMPEQHLSYRWAFRKDCRLMTFDGNRAIVFHGLDDPTKRKSEKPPLGGYFGYLWMEELNEFDREEVSSLRKSVLRGGAIGQSIYTFNPPPSKAEWVNAEAARPKPYRYVFKTTYLDILPYHPEWLGETFIEEAEEARRENTLEYRHELMGEAIGTGGEIFANCVAEEITDEQIARFKERGQDRYGLDFGFTNDPTALVETAYDEGTRTIYIWGAHGGHGLFEEDIVDLIHRRGLMNKVIVADRAEPRAIAKLRRLGVERIRECWKSPDGWVETGMSFMRSSKRSIVIDPRRAKMAWDEFSKYEYARYKNGDYHPEYPDKNNHWIDACLRGSTLVRVFGKGYIPIKNLVGSQGILLAFDERTRNFVYTPFCHVRMTRENAEMVRVELEDGRFIECTPDHRILTSNRGYVEAQYLNEKDDIVCQPLQMDEASMRVKKIIKLPVREDVYDLEVPETHNLCVNRGIVVHNCRYSLEPDIRADYTPKVWSLPKAYKRSY